MQVQRSEGSRVKSAEGRVDLQREVQEQRMRVACYYELNDRNALKKVQQLEEAIRQEGMRTEADLPVAEVRGLRKIK